MNDHEFGLAHDRYLAAYSSEAVTIYCHNRECGRYGEGISALCETEYGQSWTSPEDCPGCLGPLSFDPTPFEEEEEDVPA